MTTEKSICEALSLCSCGAYDLLIVINCYSKDFTVFYSAHSSYRSLFVDWICICLHCTSHAALGGEAFVVFGSGDFFRLWVWFLSVGTI